MLHLAVMGLREQRRLPTLPAVSLSHLPTSPPQGQVGLVVLSAIIVAAALVFVGRSYTRSKAAAAGQAAPTPSKGTDPIVPEADLPGPARIGAVPSRHKSELYPCPQPLCSHDLGFHRSHAAVYPHLQPTPTPLTSTPPALTPPPHSRPNSLAFLTHSTPAHPHQSSPSPTLHPAGHLLDLLLPFLVSGGLYGLLMGTLLGYLYVHLREAVFYTKHSDYPTDLFRSQLTYNAIIFLVAVGMSLVWGVWVYMDHRYGAKHRLLTRLPDFNDLALLLAGLSVSFNLVPGLWVTLDPNKQRAGFTGSRPDTFTIWAVLSYPSGLLTMIALMLLLEGGYLALERIAINAPTPPARLWRGYFYRRWAQVLGSYQWGYFTFWICTGVTLFVFDYHQVRP